MFIYGQHSPLWASWHRPGVVSVDKHQGLYPEVCLHEHWTIVCTLLLWQQMVTVDVLLPVKHYTKWQLVIQYLTCVQLMHLMSGLGNSCLALLPHLAPLFSVVQYHTLKHTHDHMHAHTYRHTRTTMMCTHTQRMTNTNSNPAFSIDRYSKSSRKLKIQDVCIIYTVNAAQCGSVDIGQVSSVWTSIRDSILRCACTNTGQ